MNKDLKKEVTLKDDEIRNLNTKLQEQIKKFQFQQDKFRDDYNKITKERDNQHKNMQIRLDESRNIIKNLDNEVSMWKQKQENVYIDLNNNFNNEAERLNIENISLKSKISYYESNQRKFESEIN